MRGPVNDTGVRTRIRMSENVLAISDYFEHFSLFVTAKIPPFYVVFLQIYNYDGYCMKMVNLRQNTSLQFGLLDHAIIHSG